VPAVRRVVEATGVLKGRDRRVLDATLPVDAVATQDTVTQPVASATETSRPVRPADWASCAEQPNPAG
jgi:hypothetical protein